MHQVGKYGNYYDPTFGKNYTGIFDFIEWHITGKTGVDANGFYWVADGHKIYWRNDFGNYGWGDYEYHSPDKLASLSSKKKEAEFTGSYTVYGLDTDGDGVYNHLAIDVEVKVKEPGHYWIGGVGVRCGTTSIFEVDEKGSNLGHPFDFIENAYETKPLREER